MTDSADLERRYRRLLGSYPRAFRREHEQEILAVLMDGAGADQRRPGLADSADLIISAARIRLRHSASRSPRSVVRAVRLMYAGAALELAAMVTVLLTLGGLKAAVFHRYPDLTAAQWHGIVLAHIVPVAVGAPIAAGMWLWMAWANRRGRGWARVAFAALFGLTTVSLVSAFAQGGVRYASADVIAGGVLWLVALAALGLIFSRESRWYYRQQQPSL